MRNEDGLNEALILFSVLIFLILFGFTSSYRYEFPDLGTCSVKETDHE